MVTFRKETTTFTLRTPADLPVLFRFLEAEPIPIQDWLMILPSPPETVGEIGRRDTSETTAAAPAERPEEKQISVWRGAA